LILAAVSALVTYVLIMNSRRYKELKRSFGDVSLIHKKEIILKAITFGVIAGTVIFFILRFY